MASNKKDEPLTAPPPDRWFNLSLGSSFKDPSSKFCTLRYEFKPASIDKGQPGTLNKKRDNKVTVEFHNNQHGKPKVNFEGSSEDYKENDAVLFFDGESFRLERLHRSVKRLRHVRQPGESAAAATSAGLATESSSPLLAKGPKLQASNKSPLHPLPVEVERFEIGGFKSYDTKPRDEKAVDHDSGPTNVAETSPDLENDDLEEQLDILNDDDDVGEADNRENTAEKDIFAGTGIDINIPHQNDTDDEIAEVDLSDDEGDKGPNAAEALRAQVNAEERKEQTSSSSGSSGSESSGSGNGSGSSSGSDSSSSSSESSDADSVNSI